MTWQWSYCREVNASLGILHLKTIYTSMTVENYCKATLEMTDQWFWFVSFWWPEDIQVTQPSKAIIKLIIHFVYYSSRPSLLVTVYGDSNPLCTTLSIFCHNLSTLQINYSSIITVHKARACSHHYLLLSNLAIS